MELVTRAVEWFRENESALSGMAAMAMLIGVAVSLLRHRARPLIGRLQRSNEAGPAPVSAPAGPEARSDKASVAIEEFACTGGDEARTLGAAVRHATLAAMSNRTGCKLKEDAATADYVASGSIHVSGARYRATMRLAERASGESFWSDRFEGELADDLEAQDDLATRISNALRFNLVARESRDGSGDAGAGFEADLARAAVLLLRSDADEWRAAGELIDRALEQRPEDSMVRAMKATFHLRETMIGWRDVAPEDAESAALHAHKAVQLNDRSDFAHVMLGAMHLYCGGDVAVAKRQCRRSLDLNPYYSLGMWGLGCCEIMAGSFADGALRCEKAAAVDPKFELNHRYLMMAAHGWFGAGEYERALDAAQHADERFRDVPRTLLVLTAAAVHAGRDDLARDAAQRIRAKHPTLVLSDLGGWAFPDAEPRQRYMEGLRRAGLSD